MRYAISYSSQQVSGLWSWVKDHDHIEKAFDFAGMGARNGVTAVGMVQAGLTGVADVLDGTHNLFIALSTDPKPEAMLEGLGSRFYVTETAIKTFSVGYPIQSPLDAFLTLRKQYGPYSALQIGRIADNWRGQIAREVASEMQDAIDAYRRDKQRLDEQKLLGWNELLFSLVLAGRDTRTLPALATAIAVSDRGIEWGPLNAMGSLVLLPVIIWIWTAKDVTTALVLTVFLVVVGFLDTMLKPLVMGRGLNTPTVVIFVGVIGGTLAHGIVGLFIGPIILSVAWEMAAAWIRTGDRAEAGPSKG